MFYAIRGVRGLGALPTIPPYEYPYQWVRYYEVDELHQLNVCPKNPPLGCWMIDGYAWGRREFYSQEFSPEGFTPKPLPKPFPHPPSTTPAPPTPPTYAVHTLKLRSPVRPTIDAQSSPVPLHETPGVGAVVGVGLFVAIGLTLLL